MAINFLDDTCFRVAQRKGYISCKDGLIVSQQFRLFNTCTQDAYIRVSNPSAEVSTRIICAHKPFDSLRFRIVGFTADRIHHENGYEGISRWDSGVIYLCPIHFSSSNVWESPKNTSATKRRRKRLLKTDNQLKITLTRPAEDAAEELFDLLDSDCNWYLSRVEVSVFKERLGYKFEITDDEWEEIRCGWGEGDLNDTGEISCTHFKALLLRLAEGSFSFKPRPEASVMIEMMNSREHMVGQREMEKELRCIFDKLGFDRDLGMTQVSSFTLYISTCRYITNFQCISMDRVKTFNALLVLTQNEGDRHFIKESNLSLSILKTSGWCSLAVTNESHESIERVKLDFLGTANAKTRNTNNLNDFFSAITLLPHESKIVFCFSHNFSTDQDMDVKGSVTFIPSAADGNEVTLNLPQFWLNNIVLYLNQMSI